MRFLVALMWMALVQAESLVHLNLPVLEILQPVQPHSQGLLVRAKQGLLLDPPPVTKFTACQCANNTCACCANFLVQRLPLKRNVCLNMTYNTSALTVTTDLSIGNLTLLHLEFSGRNPPPLCIPIPTPPIPVANLCIRLYNISIDGLNMNACLNLELQLQSTTVFIFYFDCLKFGLDGLTVMKPSEVSRTTERAPLLTAALSVMQQNQPKQLFHLPNFLTRNWDK